MTTLPALCATLGVCAPVLAQEVLQEVVVSAQKREQNIQDVGISISAFTGEQLAALGVRESFDIAAFTPGVHVSGNLAGQNTQFTIRGVTQNDFNDIVEAPNAVYLDEGYIAVAQAQTFALFDIDRVELLKGPQGTLFGRNATGGLVHYLSRKPSFDKVEGFADLTFGVYDSDADATQAARRSRGRRTIQRARRRRVSRACTNKRDGYLNNLYPAQAPAGLAGASPGPGAGADMGDDDTYALRGTLDFKPNDAVLLRVSANYAHSSLGTGPYQSKSTIGVVDPSGELVERDQHARERDAAVDPGQWRWRRQRHRRQLALRPALPSACPAGPCPAGTTSATSTPMARTTTPAATSHSRIRASCAPRA